MKLAINWGVEQVQRAVEEAQRAVIAGRELAAMGVSENDIVIIHGENHDLKPLIGSDTPWLVCSTGRRSGCKANSK